MNKSPTLGKGENMLELDSTIGVLKDTNIEAAKISASIVTGDVVCERLAQIVKPSSDFVFLAICHTANVEVYLLEAIERWTAINDHLMFQFVDGYLNASDPTTFNIRLRCTYGC